ncbi:hypothetical protein BJ684DRAFT_16066 [Piptocephalis cylindrospora]|uniref:Tyrosinase copper-binding domain-containing protein n=1 Tax=Piptocephalis cylindrospora TaxID=1907219 RepID=A0A4P9Y3Y8_9FUNG|nr:hypothetical protein BJ684DRAFT_16066 [Piptocephalis cylindrospora]|eukprot:RKP13543.1 hypothetical protein BJ684DRAFT_16066 [Piptocephalis cylindrospora]
MLIKVVFAAALLSLVALPSQAATTGAAAVAARSRAFLSNSRVPTSCPNGIKERKEIRSMSKAERTAFFDAVKELMVKDPSSQISTWDVIAKCHSDSTRFAHNSAWFFPWHRMYLHRVEATLQTINPNVYLPRWEWTLDSQAPEASIVFTAEFYGGNGNSKTKCITNGPFANYKPFYTPSGTSKCIQRDFDEGDRIGSFTATDILARIINRASTYSALHDSIEGSVHGGVHVGIGGIMNSMLSPQDPIFFGHHVMIDYIWWQWQKAYPSRAHTINGETSSGSTLKATDRGNFWDFQVSDVFDVEKLCYTYTALTNNDDKQPALPPPVTPSQSPDDEINDVTLNPSVSSSSAAGAAATAIADGGDTVVVAPIPGNEKCTQGKDADYDADSEGDDSEDDSSNSLYHNKSRTQYDRNSKHKKKWGTKGKYNGRKYGRKHGKSTGGKYKGDATGSQPGYSDRSHLTRIRNPKPLDRAWCIRNGLSYEKVQAKEAEYSQVYQELNSIQGYVSPSALWNRNDLLVVLAVKVAAFKADVDGSIVTVSHGGGSALQVISNCKSKISGAAASQNVTVGVPPSVVQGDLIEILGTPNAITAPPNSPISPYTSKPKNPKPVKVKVVETTEDIPAKYDPVPSVSVDENNIPVVTVPPSNDTSYSQTMQMDNPVATATMISVISGLPPADLETARSVASSNVSPTSLPGSDDLSKEAPDLNNTLPIVSDTINKAVNGSSEEIQVPSSPSKTISDASNLLGNSSSEIELDSSGSAVKKNGTDDSSQVLDTTLGKNAYIGYQNATDTLNAAREGYENAKSPEEKGDRLTSYKEAHNAYKSAKENLLRLAPDVNLPADPSPINLDGESNESQDEGVVNEVTQNDDKENSGSQNEGVVNEVTQNDDGGELFQQDDTAKEQDNQVEGTSSNNSPFENTGTDPFV